MSFDANDTLHPVTVGDVYDSSPRVPVGSLGHASTVRGSMGDPLDTIANGGAPPLALPPPREWDTRSEMSTKSTTCRKTPYSTIEDIRILVWLWSMDNERSRTPLTFNEPTGATAHKLWDKAVQLGVTTHSAASMRERYRKQLKPLGVLERLKWLDKCGDFDAVYDSLEHPMSSLPSRGLIGNVPGGSSAISSLHVGPPEGNPDLRPPAQHYTGRVPTCRSRKPPITHRAPCRPITSEALMNRPYAHYQMFDQPPDEEEESYDNNNYPYERFRGPIGGGPRMTRRGSKAYTRNARFPQLDMMGPLRCVVTSEGEWDDDGHGHTPSPSPSQSRPSIGAAAEAMMVEGRGALGRDLMDDCGCTCDMRDVCDEDRREMTEIAVWTQEQRHKYGVRPDVILETLHRCNGESDVTEKVLYQLVRSGRTNVNEGGTEHDYVEDIVTECLKEARHNQSVQVTQ